MIRRIKRIVQQLINAKEHWTRIEKIKLRSDYACFRQVYERVIETILKGIPSGSVSSCQAAFSETETCYLLYKTIRDKKPKVVIETGTFLGLSTLICATALQENHKQYGILGKIYSISLNSFYRVDQPLKRAARACHKLGLSEYAHFIEGSSGPVTFMETSDSLIAQHRYDYLRNYIITENRECLLHRLVGIVGKVDMAFLDSLHYEAFQMTEVSAVLGNLGNDGCLFIDDVLLSNRRDDILSLLSNWLHLDFHIYRLFDFIRCGFRFYYAPWIVDSFRWSNIAHVTMFKHNNCFLRIIKLMPSLYYHTHYGRLATWYAAESLEEFLMKYELKLTEGEKGRLA